MKIQNSKIKGVSVISVCVSKKLTLLTDTVTAIFNSRRDGFTLIEMVLIIIIVAVAIPALLIVLGQGTRQSVDAELQVTATNVAQALLEGIKTKRWDENSPIPPGTYTTPLGPETGETWNINHSNYDDVDDYNNLYANSGNADAVIVGGVTYTRDVQVCYVPSSNLNDTSACSTVTDYKRIKVTVTNTTLGSVELVTVVTNY
jgi:MSHA pilin protein MshD